ncbi:MAG: hypothetical protein AAF219_07905 [Myxococcota bacterium]
MAINELGQRASVVSDRVVTAETPEAPIGDDVSVVPSSRDTLLTDAGRPRLSSSSPSLDVRPDRPTEIASVAGIPPGAIPIPNGEYSVRGSNRTYEFSRESDGDRTVYRFTPAQGRRGPQVRPNAYGHDVLTEVDTWFDSAGIVGGASPASATFVSDEDEATNMLALWRNGPNGGSLGGLRLHSPTGAIEVDHRVLNHLPPDTATRIFGPDATEYTQLQVNGEPMLAVGYTNADGNRSTMYFDAAHELSFWETRLPDGRYRIEQGTISGQSALPNNFAAFSGASPGEKVVVDYRDNAVVVTPESGGQERRFGFDDRGNVVTVNGETFQTASIEASTSVIGDDELGGSALTEELGFGFDPASTAITGQRRAAFQQLQDALFVRGSSYAPVVDAPVENSGDPDTDHGVTETLAGWADGPWADAIAQGRRGISTVVPGLDLGQSVSQLDSDGDTARFEVTAEVAFPTPWGFGGKADLRRGVDVVRTADGAYDVTVEDRGRLRAVFEANGRNVAAGVEPGVEGRLYRTYTFGSPEEVNRAIEYFGREVAETAVNNTGPGVLGLGGLFGPSREDETFMESHRDSVAADLTGLLRTRGTVVLPRRVQIAEELRLDPRAFIGAEVSDGPPPQLTLSVGLSGEATSKAGPGIRSTRARGGVPAIAPHRDDEIVLDLVYHINASAPNDPLAVLERLGDDAHPNAVRLRGLHSDYELLRDGSLPLLGRGDFDRAEWSLEARGASADRISERFLAGDIEGALVAGAESGLVDMTEYTDVQGSGTSVKPELKVGGVGVALIIEAGRDDVDPKNVTHRQMDANDLAAWVGQRFDPVAAAERAVDGAVGFFEDGMPDEAYVAVIGRAIVDALQGGDPQSLEPWHDYMNDAYGRGDLDRLERGFGFITLAARSLRHPVAPYMDRWLNGDGSDLVLDYTEGGRLWRAPLGVQTEGWFLEQPNIAQATSELDAEATRRIQAGVADGSLPAEGTITLEPRDLESNGAREPLAYSLLGQFNLHSEYRYRSTAEGLVIEPVYSVDDRWDMDPGRGNIEEGDLLDHDWGVALQEAGRAQPYWVRVRVPGEPIRVD